MVGGKSFNTEHKLNKYKHIKPMKKKRRRLGSDHNEAACKEVEELTKVEILRKIGRNLEAYVDDMVIKNMSEEDMLQDIQETFDRANSSKVKAVIDLKSPRTLKEIQSLNGKLAALSHFLSKGAEKSIPFFKALKSCTGEVLVMYLAALVESISDVLLAEREEKQVPIYFVNKIFQGHPIRVLTDVPIKQMLTSPEKLGRVAKWAIELGEHDIEFGERGFRKTQILKDFSIETPPEEGQKAVIRRVDTRKEGPKLENIWKLYTDRASSSDGSGIGLMLISPEGKEYTYALRF
ncbi:hypothetical protein Tco_1570377 [Tanacetum coccineum]